MVLGKRNLHKTRSKYTKEILNRPEVCRPPGVSRRIMTDKGNIAANTSTNTLVPVKSDAGTVLVEGILLVSDERMVTCSF